MDAAPIDALPMNAAERRGRVAEGSLRPEHAVPRSLTRLARKFDFGLAGVADDTEVRGVAISSRDTHDGDLVFIATVGPCRVFDSRFGPGPLPAFGIRQICGVEVRILQGSKI